MEASQLERSAGGRPALKFKIASRRASFRVGRSAGWLAGWRHLFIIASGRLAGWPAALGSGRKMLIIRPRSRPAGSPEHLRPLWGRESAQMIQVGRPAGAPSRQSQKIICLVAAAAAAIPFTRLCLITLRRRLGSRQGPDLSPPFWPIQSRRLRAPVGLRAQPARPPRGPQRPAGSRNSTSRFVSLCAAQRPGRHTLGKPEAGRGDKLAWRRRRGRNSSAAHSQTRPISKCRRCGTQSEPSAAKEFRQQLGRKQASNLFANHLKLKQQQAGQTDRLTGRPPSEQARQVNKQAAAKLRKHNTNSPRPRPR